MELTPVLLLLNVLFVSCLALEGDVEKYTKEEVMALAKFRPLVKDVKIPEYEKTPAYLVKWLRARKLNTGEAYKMLENAQRWRTENNVDNILNETIFQVHPEPYTAHGYDLNHHPMLIIAPFSFDMRKYVVGGAGKRLSRYVIQGIEKAMRKRREYSKKFGKEITNIILILDAHGFNLRQHFCLQCIPVLQDIFVTLETYYPNTIKQMIGINVPRIAFPAVEIMKSIISKQLAAGIKVFPPDKKLWQEYLQTIAAKDQLPYKFGGTYEIDGHENMVTPKD